uniref:LRRCT domain-containing protein n=1 Tax=Branchiostoma floridae TaxID=7739 RepID=C3YF02_BRAFL|eukprot:XP_002605236.1 hypothetical protein BRAFLDRAFT_92291 [Branchiostoma floridae]
MPCTGVQNNYNCKTTAIVGVTLVNCKFSHLGLHDFPVDVPPNVTNLDVSFNNIRNLTSIPYLGNLHWLELKWSRIETVSWVSLRALPVLEFLFLNWNKITHVKLSIVAKYLPKLFMVDLSNNRIKSVSGNDLALPALRKALILNNPFNCDCSMIWLIKKLRCLQECGAKFADCCIGCNACFLTASRKGVDQGSFVCASPTSIQGLKLSDAARILTTCEEPTFKSIQTPDSPLGHLTLTTAHYSSINHSQTCHNISDASLSEVRMANTHMDIAAVNCSQPPTENFTRTVSNKTLTVTQSYFLPSKSAVSHTVVSIPRSKPTRASHMETSNPKLTLPQIVIIATTSFLALVFILYVTMRMVKSRCSDDDDTAAVATNGMMMHHVIPPIQNTMYGGTRRHPGHGTAAVATNAMMMHHIIPPIQNTMYGGTRRQPNSTDMSHAIPQLPDSNTISMDQIVPPIVNTLYRSTQRPMDVINSNDTSTSSSQDPPPLQSTVDRSCLGLVPSRAFPHQRMPVAASALARQVKTDPKLSSRPLPDLPAGATLLGVWNIVSTDPETDEESEHEYAEIHDYETVP